MIVAIAGASGFVGRALTAQLLDGGHDVVALGRSLASLPTEARAIAVTWATRVQLPTPL
jgi:nucleoside-diphosphate-sugar epimerase